MDDGPAAGAYSQAAAQVMAAQQTLHPDCDPNGRTTECACKTPIIVCVDVTGSMGDWTKVIWDKMPMCAFYGEKSPPCLTLIFLRQVLWTNHDASLPG